MIALRAWLTNKEHQLRYFALLILAAIITSGIKLGANHNIATKTTQITQIVYTDNILINRGDTLEKLLEPYGLEEREISQIIKATKSSEWDASRLSIGKALQVRHTIDRNSGKAFSGLLINLDNKRKIEINKVNGEYKANNITINFTKDLIKISGHIESSIIGSGLKAGIPMQNLTRMIKLYSHQLDFQRDLRRGDKFTVLLEKFTSEDGKSFYFGDIVHSSLTLGKNTYNIYRFKSANGEEDFFDDHYQSVHRSLLRTPLMATKISSGFGMRRHPISGYTTMHRGIDFAAPTGTPIYSAGNGVITEMGSYGGYGRYIRIRHTSDMSTAYGHVHSFAKGLGKGSRVKQGQLIAYVGSSGSATGAHLHYEVIVNGVKINPLKVKTLPIRKLTGADRRRFAEHKKAIDALSESFDAPPVSSNRI